MSQNSINAVVAGGSVMALFLNSMGNCRFTFKNGKDAVFLNGRYLTNNEGEIKELMEEVALGHPYISTNPDELVVETKFIDPMEAIRAQVIAQYKAEQAAIAAANQDMGTSDQSGKLDVGNTKNVAEAMSGSTSMDGASGVTAAATPTPPTAKIVLGGK